MFYQGDLQSGIALAVREAKSVVCFVRDDQDESAKWENEYFEDDINQLLSDNSVTLRLTAGTQEAGFLTSICPIQAFPAVLVIMNGVVQDYIAAGTHKEDFQTRLKTAVVNRNAQQPSTSTTTSTETTSDANQQPPVASSVPTEPSSQPRQVTTNEQRPVETTQPARPAPQQTQTDKKEKDRRALQLKLQREKMEQKEERERIRNQIKQDQEARKQRSAEERNRSKTAAAAETQGTSTVPAAAQNTSGTASARKPVSEYRLQVRLFDGSSVRASFPLSATIRKDVRPWLEGHRGGDSQPYNLKHILTPLPNYTISAAEEERALEEIGLGPTASLVMVPVPSYIEAYASPSLTDSLPGRAVSAGYGLVSGVVGGAAGLVGSFLGIGVSAAAAVSSRQAATSSSDDSNQSTATSSRPTPRMTGGGINVRTLRDQEQDRNEFYNGNTLNFEPKRNDDHKND
ncbi:uncharacterized protein TRUGW13939_11176 [Talaromyces rugulosus]|uniref:UBX domain-containing protein n=1 Tax=Talaromyces rugulosus TaxID=121627 RepID=A0A7H8RHE3_TALRU|nr:uncharacterized protein TRUGW13939_11176 [Talaromyces rugulosus]QKX64003.1 hypothetical protein TRUGW13939_11176 [Talaromyces rugulosus]